MPDLIPELSFSFWIELGVALSLIVTAFIAGRWKELIKKKKKANIDWSVHTQIHEFLTELRVITHAARAQLIQFHNGEYFLDGVSMQKLSMTHESLSNGVSSEIHNKTNVLLSLYSTLMDKLDLNDVVHYKTQNEKEGYFKNILDLGNVHSYSVLPIFIAGTKCGFLMVEWCSDHRMDYAEKNFSKLRTEIFYARNVIQTKLAQQLKQTNAIK